MEESTDWLYYCSWWPDHAEWFEFLHTLPFEHEPEIVVYNRVVRQPRNIVMYGSPEMRSYYYSKRLHTALDWNTQPRLRDMIVAVNAALNENFNAALINQYTDGTRSIGKHSDDTSRLAGGAQAVVATLSFGTRRTFRVRDKTTSAIVRDFDLGEGDLLVMRAGFQSKYTHEVPIRRGVNGERISVTLRQHG